MDELNDVQSYKNHDQWTTGQPVATASALRIVKTPDLLDRRDDQRPKHVSFDLVRSNTVGGGLEVDSNLNQQQMPYRAISPQG